jgi:hypothetical protein
MNKTQTISEINKLHNEWVPKYYKEGMSLNSEILKFYSWLQINKTNIFNHGTFEPENSFELIARVTSNIRRRYKF